MEKLNDSTRTWAANRFKIDPETILWYHSGICYDRIGVTTPEAAQQVAEQVKDRYVNGGMLHGMSLGQISFMQHSKIPHYDVMV